MSGSKFQYVRHFELTDAALPLTHLVIRVDGHRFSNFVKEHGFAKPVDVRGVELMTDCAKHVMAEWSDVVMAYGHSDEYSFLLPTTSNLYNRRACKIASSFASLFASTFVFLWPRYFPDQPLLFPPAFDGKLIPHPTKQHVRDYFSWRQADCHVNNLYNACYWRLVQVEGMNRQEAEQLLKGTVSGDKHEMLFTTFGVNYNNLPELERKGTVLWRVTKAIRGKDGTPALRQANIDIIRDDFWMDKQHLLS
ncbi:unnamed protein product [Chrysoparadoxa australica]